MNATGSTGYRYRDLLRAVLDGQPRVQDAVCVWRHHPVADQSTQSLVDATLAYQQRFDTDWVKLTPAATWQLIDFGLVDEWHGDAIGRREVVQRAIRRPDDWSTLKPQGQSRFTSRIIAAVDQLRRRMPPDIPLLATVFSPSSQATLLAGRELLLGHLQTHPEHVHEGLALLTCETTLLIKELLAAGADGIHYAVQTASGELFPEPFMTVTPLAADLETISAAKSAEFNVVHLHGDYLHPAWGEAFADYPLHFDAGAPGNPELADMPATSVVLGAPVPVATFSATSPPALRTAVLKQRKAMQNRRFILAPGCSLPLDVSDTLVDAFVAAAREPLPHEEAP